MRTYKITLIIMLVFVMILLFLGVSGIDTISNPDAGAIFILLLIGIVLGLLTMVFHVKSFRYYSISKRHLKVKKLSIVLWVCAIVLSIYVLIFAVFSTIGLSMGQYKYNTQMIIMLGMVLLLFFYGVGSLIEVFILKKRIKILHEENTLHNEIDEIGN
jgi:amino acid transporter